MFGDEKRYPSGYSFQDEKVAQIFQEFRELALEKIVQEYLGFVSGIAVYFRSKERELDDRKKNLLQNYKQLFNFYYNQINRETYYYLLEVIEKVKNNKKKNVDSTKTKIVSKIEKIFTELKKNIRNL
ncbi:hypothetical protein [Anoxybacter fermentans]|uniref:hypothetical protein n=1 Tax=Anoxybacter fermentans TaxID=1323375 RepID=UPI0013DE8428|nr:hypothetical protein [Anoxybacter fermentans]